MSEPPAPPQPPTLGGGGQRSSGSLFTPEQQAEMGLASLTPQRSSRGDASNRPSGGSLFTPEQQAELGITRPVVSASKAATPGGKKSLFTPEQQAQLYADEKRDGYELQATPSGTAVLVPTGNRAISIEAPPEDAPGVSLPPGLSPKQPSPNAPKR